MPMPMPTLMLMLLVAAAGCGNVRKAGGESGSDVDSGGSDSTDGATAPDGAAADADGTPARCDPVQPFGPGEEIATWDIGLGEDKIDLSADELSATISHCCGSGGGSDWDINYTARETRDEPFAAPQPLGGVNTTGVQRGPRMSPDGMTLYVTTRATTYDISSSVRADPDATFGPLAPVADLNGTTDDSDPFVLPDGSAVYFASTRVAAQGYDIYSAARNATGFDQPEPVPGDVNTVADEGAPIVTDGGLTIYFSSRRGGGAGDFDIYVATRASRSDPFGPATVLEQLNSIRIDAPSWVSPDGCQLYYTSAVSGKYLLYVAVRPAP
jgi:hypothetical protein